MNGTTTNQYQTQRVERGLNDPYHDIYLARYDPEHDSCIPIADPFIPERVKAFLPLPYQNASRYPKILGTLKRFQNSTEVYFEDLTRGIQSYISKQIDFTGLRHFISDLSHDERRELSELIRYMAGLALELNGNNFTRIPLLTTGGENSISMTQHQAAIILANGFFCTFEDSMKHMHGTYNTFSFIQLFSSNTFKANEKLKCIFAYFKTIQKQMPKGMITILRQTCPFIRFEDINPPLINVRVESTGFIEQQIGEAHVDFANNFIGGGVLGHGTVQEEIRFIIAPETLISCLVCERMNKNEAILILGTQQYSNYRGYRNSFRYEPRDNSARGPKRSALGHYPSCIIAIDAIRYTRPETQFVRMCIDREIRKAFIGFAIKLPEEFNVIATGNWGCGAFNGNQDLKFLIQFIAASAAGRDLHYLTFDGKHFSGKIKHLLETLENQNVSFKQLYNRLIGGKGKPSVDFILNPFKYILEYVEEKPHMQTILARRVSPAPDFMDVDVSFHDEKASSSGTEMKKEIVVESAAVEKEFISEEDTIKDLPSIMGKDSIKDTSLEDDSMSSDKEHEDAQMTTKQLHTTNSLHFSLPPKTGGSTTRQTTLDLFFKPVPKRKQ